MSKPLLFTNARLVNEGEEREGDLLIVDGEPSQDVAILKDKAAIELVMKSGGIVVDRR